MLPGIAEQLPLPDHSADTVVSTLVLCSVTDLPRAAREITRVLRPTGQLLLLEHVRAGTPTAQRWQHRVTPLQRRVAAGCHLGRDTLSALHDAGLRTGQLRTWAMPGPFGRLMPVVEVIASLSS